MVGRLTACPSSSLKVHQSGFLEPLAAVREDLAPATRAPLCLEGGICTGGNWPKRRLPEALRGPVSRAAALRMWMPSVCELLRAV